jgi:hypothetical protein
MTNRSVSWTDPQEVARLLRQVTGTSPVGTGTFMPVRDTARSRVHTPAADFKPRLTPVPIAIRPSVPPARVVPKLQQTSDNPSERLDALIAWALDNFVSTGAFVADDNGLTLAAHGISEAHVALVGPLFSALVGIRTIPGIDGTAGALWLGANMMSWVESRTERGSFCLGILGPEPLPNRSLEQLREALDLTMTGF